MTGDSTRTTPTPGRELRQLAGPIVLTQLAQVALTTTDTIMMGMLGVEALAAGGLSVVLFNQLRTMGVGLLTPVGNLVAQAVARLEHQGGRSDGLKAEVRAVVGSSFLVATLCGLVCWGALALLGSLVGSLGQDATIAALTARMTLTLAPGLVPCLWFQVLRQYTVGMRRPQALLLITLGSVVLNAALNWVLITGSLGAPRLGLAGIGAATSLVHLATALALGLAVVRDAELRPMFTLSPRSFRLGTVRQILRLGFPVAATYGSEAGLFSVAGVVVGTFGAPALAAYNVVNQLTYVVFQMSVGISHGSSILVSRMVGLRRFADLRLVARTAHLHAAAVLAGVAVLYLAWPDLVLRWFMTDAGPEALHTAAVLLVIASAGQFADSAQNIGIGLLRGLGDTTSGFVVSLIGYWGVGLPVGLLLAYGAELGVYGIWLGLTAGLTTTAVLLRGVFHRRLRTLTTT